MARLKHRSTLLEADGRSAKEEAEVVRAQLSEASEGLATARREAAALEARLGPLERECREAQTAQEHLRWGGWNGGGKKAEGALDIDQACP